MNNWRKEFTKQFRYRDTSWEGTPVEYSIESWKAENLSDLSKSDMFRFIETELIEKLIAEIPDYFTTFDDNGTITEHKAFQQQLRAKWLGKETNA